MPGAVIAIDQDRPAGTSFGNPGIARKDLWLTRTVRPRCTTSGNTSFLWALEDVPPGSATEITSGTETVSSCDFDPDTDGSYRVKLVTNGGGPGNVQILICAVTRDQNGNLLERGWRVPALGEQGTEANFGGQTRGWDESIRQILDDIRNNAFTGGPSPSGSGADDGAALRAVNFSTRTSRPALLATDLPTGSTPVTGVALVDSVGDTNFSPFLYYVSSNLEATRLNRVSVLTTEQEQVLALDEAGPLFAHGNMLLVVGNTVCYINAAPASETVFTISPPLSGTGFGGLATVGTVSSTAATYWFITSPNDNNVYRVALNPGADAIAAIALTGVPDPYGIATDDAGNIWVAFPDDGTVQKYEISPSGTLVASGAPVVAHITSNLVFDGKYIFGLNKGGDFESPQIVRIAVADDSVMAVASSYVDTRSFITFDGGRLWFTGSHRTIAFHPETLDVLVTLSGTVGDAHGQIIADSKTGNLFVALPVNAGSSRSVLFYSHGHYESFDGLRLRSVAAGQFLRADPDTAEIVGVAQGVVTPLTLTGESDIVELTVKGAPGQTANFQEWRTSTNSLKAAVTAAGSLLLAALSTAGVVHADTSGLLSTSQVIDAEIATVSWSKVTGTPTTLSGYGITDGVRGSPTGDLNTVLASDGVTNSWTGAPVLSTSLSFAKAGAAPIISQQAQTDDTGCHDFTIRTQAPFASATGANRNPGNLVLDVPAPASGGASGFLNVSVSSATRFAFGLSNSGTPTMWAAGVTTSDTNYVFLSNGGSSTSLNSPSATGRIGFGHANVLAAQISPATSTNTGFRFAAAFSVPVFGQITQASDTPTFDLTIRPQAPFASATTNKNPGNLVFDIPSPVSGGATGFVQYTNNGVVAANIGLTTTAAIPAIYLGTATPDNNNYAVAVVNSSGKLLLNSQLSTSLVALGAHNATIVSFGRSGTVGASFSHDLAYTIGQDALASDIATHDLTIASQVPFASATGTNRNPGNLVLVVPAPATGGADGFSKFSISGNTRAQIGVYPFDTTYGAVWLGGVTPTNLNYVVSSNGQFAFINGTSSVSIMRSDATMASFLQFASANHLSFANDQGAGIDFASLLSDTAAHDLTLTSQPPWVSATTNKNPGNIVLDVPAPVSGGAIGFHKFSIGGSTKVWFSATSVASTSGQIYLGTPTPTLPAGAGVGTYAFSGDGSTILTINAPAASASLSFAVANNNRWLINDTFFGAASGQAAQIQHRIRTSDAACFDFTIQSQQPFASATGTNRNPGNLVLAVPAPVSGGAHGFLYANLSGNNVFALQQTTSSNFVALYLGGSIASGTGASAPTTTNYILQSDGDTTVLVNSPNAAGRVSITINNVTKFNFKTDRMQAVQNQAGLIELAQRVSDAACFDFTLQAQAPFATATGTNQNPGNLILAVPAPVTGGSPGYVKISTSGTVTQLFGVYPLDTTYAATWLGAASPTSSNYAVAGNNSTTYVNSTGSIVLARSDALVAAFQNFSSANHMTWALDTSVSIDFVNLTSDVVAHDITIQSQPPWASATTNKSPGAVILAIPAPISGGSNNYAKVTVGGTLYAQVGKGGIPNWGYLYLGNAAAAASNYVLISDGATGTFVSGPSTDGYVGMGANASPIAYFSKTGGQGITITGLAFDVAFATPTIGQSPRTTDAATVDLTFQSQAPFASATGSNRNPGNLVFNIPAPASGGTLGFTKLSFGGSAKAFFGASSTASSSGYFFLGTATPVFAGGAGVGNYALSGDGATSVVLNAPGTSASIIFTVANNTRWTILDSRIQATSVQAAEIAHNGRTSDAATADFTIRAQAPFATATTNKNPGNLVYIIPAPVGGGTAGKHSFQVSDAEVLAIGLTTMSMSSSFNKITTAATELILEQTGDTFGATRLHLQNRGGVNGAIFENAGVDLVDFLFTGTSHSAAFRMEGRAGITFLATQPEWQIGASAGNPTLVVNTVATGIGFRTPLVQFIKDQASPKIFQAAQTTDTACFDLTIESQAPFASATGTNRNPGNLIHSVPAPASGGATGKHSFKISAAEVVALQRLNASTVQLNVPTDAFSINIAGGGATYFQVSTLLAYLDATTLNFRDGGGGTPYGNFSGSGLRIGDLTAANQALDVVGNTHISGFVSFGTNFATQGAARFPNNTGFYGRNAANSGDIIMLQLNSSDAVNIGDSNANGVNANVKTGATFQVTVNGTGYFIVNSTSVRDAHIAAAGLAHFDNVGNFSSSLLVDADVSSSAAIATSKLGQGGASTGQLLAWSGSAWAAATQTIIKTKASDESVTSSTVLQNDDDLSFSIAASETWVVRWTIWMTCAAGNGAKVAVAGPSGVSTLIIAQLCDDVNSFVTSPSGEGSSINLSVSIDDTTGMIVIEATVVNGASAGTINLQWAQVSSSGTATTFKAKSKMVAQKKF